MSINYQKITLESFLDSLSLYSGYKIAYDVDALPLDSLLNIDAENTDLQKLLGDVLAKLAVDISYLGKQIIIGKKRIETKQQQATHFKVKGTVSDEESQQPLALVNISVVNHSMGTITNMDGQFELKIPVELGEERLAFSFLGYNTGFVNLDGADSLYHVDLSARAVRLREVEVAYRDPDKIIDQFLKYHPDNYWKKQALLSGFFRESIQQDGDYVQVSEAIVNITKPSYQKPANMERVKFIKGRKKDDLQQMNMVEFKLEGGPFQFSRVDVARYLDFFPHKENSIYSYSYEGVEVLDDEWVHKIQFKPFDDNGELLYTGMLFIHSLSFALVRCDFQLTKKALRYSGKALVRKSSRKIRVKPLKAEYRIDYRRYQGKWILKDVKGDMLMRINDKRQKINSVFRATTELLISNWELNENYKIKPSELYRSKYILAETIRHTDEDFWENYNIIRADEDLQKVFKHTKVVSK